MEVVIDGRTLRVLKNGTPHYTTSHIAGKPVCDEVWFPSICFHADAPIGASVVIEDIEPEARSMSASRHPYMLGLGASGGHAMSSLPVVNLSNTFAVDNRNSKTRVSLQGASGGRYQTAYFAPSRHWRASFRNHHRRSTSSPTRTAKVYIHGLNRVSGLRSARRHRGRD